MAVITTGNHPKNLWPGIQEWWGREYNKYPPLYSQMFDVTSSGQSYEEDVEVTGFGLAPVKSEGTSTSYDSEVQGETKRYTHTAYALGYICTYEELRDGLYPVVSQRRASALAFSGVSTKETVAANVFNRATNSSYTGGDGKSMLATDHPTTSGDQSNMLATAADFSEASVEDLVIQIRKAKNDRGLRIQIMPQRMIIPPDLEFEYARVIRSVLQNDTANNAINALRATGTFSQAPVINPYLSDVDQWFIKTNCPSGLKFIQREAASFERDNDFDTKNAKASYYERYSVGWTDWRGVYGSEGA